MVRTHIGVGAVSLTAGGARPSRPSRFAGAHAAARSFRRDFAFHHEAGFHLVPAGAVPCALHGWLPLYCGLVAAAALGVFFLAIYARSLVGRLCFWLRRARKIDVDAALIAAASGSECAICFEDPAQLLVFLPCGHRCVCASCAERIERRCRRRGRALPHRCRWNKFRRTSLRGDGVGLKTPFLSSLGRQGLKRKPRLASCRH